MSRYVHNPPPPEQIAAERKAANASVPAAAGMIGVTETTWSRYESGATRMHPAYFELFRIKSQLLNETARRAAAQNRNAKLCAEGAVRALLELVPTHVRLGQSFYKRSVATLAMLRRYDQALNGAPTAAPPPAATQETDDDGETDGRTGPGRTDGRRDEFSACGAIHGR